MTARDFDPYVEGSSIAHQLDPRTKLSIAVLFALAVLSVPSGRMAHLIALSCLLFPAMAASGLPARITMARAIPAAGMIALASVGLLFQGSTSRFCSVSLKAVDCTVAAVLLTGTTPYHQLLAALRALRTPGMLVSVAGVAYRLVFVALEEAARMVTAYRCRIPSASMPRRVHHTVRIAQALCTRTAARSVRLEHALLARGFDGELRSLPLGPYPSREALTAAFVFVLIASISLAAYR